MWKGFKDTALHSFKFGSLFASAIHTPSKISGGIINKSQASILASSVEDTITNGEIVSQMNRLCEIVNLDKKNPNQTIFEQFKSRVGWCVRKKKSTIQNAGNGAFLDGKVSSHTIVSIYPGLIYLPGDPLLFPSIKNPYIIRRSDGITIDGKYYGFSRFMFSNLSEKIGGKDFGLCDTTWIDISKDDWETRLSSPLALGQMINDYRNPESPNALPNVMYCECELPIDFSSWLVPHIHYGGSVNQGSVVKSIVMVTLREICDEELFSDYRWVGIPKT